MNEADAETGITALIKRAAEDEEARNALYERVYGELKKSARRLLVRQDRDVLQTTAVVNEVLLRIEKSGCLADLGNRRIFFAVTATAMRQVLIDHYRERQARFEGRLNRQGPLDTVIDNVQWQTRSDFETLAEELSRLELESPRQYCVIMHRFFGGRTAAETAELLEVSAETVHRDWRLARAKLFQRLRHDE